MFSVIYGLLVIRLTRLTVWPFDPSFGGTSSRQSSPLPHPLEGRAPASPAPFLRPLEGHPLEGRAPASPAPSLALRRDELPRVQPFPSSSGGTSSRESSSPAMESEGAEPPSAN